MAGTTYDVQLTGVLGDGALDDAETRMLKQHIADEVAHVTQADHDVINSISGGGEGGSGADLTEVKEMIETEKSERQAADAEITAKVDGCLPLTDGVFSGLTYMEEAATVDPTQNIVVLGATAIMNRISIGQQDPTGFDANKLYSFKYFEAGPLGMKGFVDYLKAKGVSETITSAIRTNGVQIQDTGITIDSLVSYQTFQNSNDPAPRKTIQLANHDTISGITTSGTGVNIAMVSKWDKVDLGSSQVAMNLNATDGTVTVNDAAVVVTSENIATYAPAADLSNFYTKEEVDQKVAGVLTYKGTVETVDALNEIEAPKAGDVYHVVADGSEHAFNGTAWEELGSEVDLTGYATEEAVTEQIAAAQSAVETKVTEETAAREAADTSLDNRLTSVESGKVDKVEGKSLVDDAEITRLASVTNYDDAAINASISELNTSVTDLESSKQDVITVGENLTFEGNQVGLSDMVATYVHPAEGGDRKHLLLANHDSIIGALSDGSNNVTIAMLSKWDKVEIGSSQVQLNLNTKGGAVQVNDSSVLITNNDIPNYLTAVIDRISILEDRINDLQKTDIATVGTLEEIASIDTSKDIVLTVADTITTKTTIEGKSIDVKQATTENTDLTLKSTGDVTVKNLTTEGELKKTASNAQIKIPSGDYIRITNSTVNQTGYNGIEVGLSSAVTSVTINNVLFNSTLSNNAISIFATEDGAVITISNCTFVKCSNPIRLSNNTGSKVTVNIVNCEFTEWESIPAYAGIIIFQDYTSEHDAVESNNLFGPDKVTINMVGCTHNGKKIMAPANIADVCATGNADTQLFYVYADNLNGNGAGGVVPYSADRYPVINIA